MIAAQPLDSATQRMCSSTWRAVLDARSSSVQAATHDAYDTSLSSSLSAHCASVRQTISQRVPAGFFTQPMRNARRIQRTA